MATVIDQLMVTLGLDSSGFDSGRKKAEDGLDKTKKNTNKLSKDIAESGKVGAEFFSTLEKSAIKFFAIFTAGRGISDFTNFVIHGGASLARMSQNLGMSTERLSKWGAAVEYSGGKQESFFGTLKGIQDQMSQFMVTGQSSMMPWLAGLGVSWRDSNGKAKDTIQLLQDVGDKLRGLPRTRARYVAEQLGIDEGTFNLLMNSRKEIDKIVASQRGISQQQADTALKVEQKWTLTKNRLESQWRDLIIKLAPQIEKISDSLVQISDKVVPVVGMMIDKFLELDKATDGWSTTIALTLVGLKSLFGVNVLSGLASVAGKIAGIGSAATSATTGGVAMLALKLAGLAGMVLYSQGLGVGEQEEINQRILNDPTVPESQKQKIREWQKINQDAYGESSTTIAKPEGNTTYKKGGTIPQRLNNPGSLRYAGQTGATEDESGFAKFGSTVDGFAALARQLSRYQERGINTIAELVHTYAPQSDNNDEASYRYALEKATGLKSNQEFDVTKNPEMLRKLMYGISQKEDVTNKLANWRNIDSGINQAVSDKSIVIQNLNVTAKTDNPREFGQAVSREIQVQQANSGVR